MRARAWPWSASSAPACSSATASSPRRSPCCPRSRASRSRRPTLTAIRAADQRRRDRRAVRRAVRAAPAASAACSVRSWRCGSCRSALLGAVEIVQHPFVLLALSPDLRDRRSACITGGWPSSCSGAVVLCVTGAEALYADMGHFGRATDPPRLAVLRAALPGAQLFRPGRAAAQRSPAAARTRSSCSARNGPACRMVMLATAATVIASQAMISGAYSIARQCVQLGFLPRLTVRHTSTMEEGQIYLPQVNVALLVGVIDPGAGVQDLRQPGRGLRHRRHRHLPVHQRAGDGGVPPRSSTGRGWPRSRCSASSS